MLGSQRLQGGLPGKRQHCPSWRVPRRNVFLPDHNFIPLSFHSLGGMHSAEKDLPWLLAAVKFWYCFLLWPKMLACWETFCGCVGRAPPSPSPICREVTWHSFLALTWIREDTRGITASCGAFRSMAAVSLGEQRAFPAPR